jgi:threonine aldolase
MMRYDFASDTAAGAMPEAMAALIRFNAGAMGGYGEDAVCAEAAETIRRLLDVDAEVWFVASGTAANAVCLAALTAPHEAVLAHAHAHVIVDETGAPGFFGGGIGLSPLAGASGRIDPDALAEALRVPETSDSQAPATLSITQATEYGAVYPETEISRLVRAAKDAGLKVHVDGARMAHAAASGFDIRAIGRLGVDILVLGGSKVGAPPTEAIVVINPALRRRFAARLKHGGQLTAKSRYLAAPWIGMLQDGAWIRRAAHANAMAKRLADQCPLPILHPVETCAVFVALDEAGLARLRGAGWAAGRFSDGSVRFMCSWATTPDLVDEFAAVLRSIV